MTSSEEDQIGRAFRAGLRFVSYRPRSRQEIRRRLGRRFGAGVVELALAKRK